MLLSEAVVDVHPTEVGSVAKFIEIINPTDTSIDLGDIYLTNAQLFPTNRYWEIVLGDGSGGGGAGAKWHCRFPTGASIAAGDTMAIAIKGSQAYATAYGRLPDFELYEDGLAPDEVPELVAVFPGSIGYGLGTSNSNQPPDLARIAGSIVLYHWDGQSDLVSDVDYLTWGTDSNVRFDKTGVSIDGPDADTDPSTYLPDTPVVGQVPVATLSNYFGKSFQRTSAEEGTEPASGGNGLTSHDESGEPLNTTWGVLDGRDPPTEATTFFPPAAVFTGTSLEPGAPFADRETTVTANLVSFAGVASVTLYFSVDGGAFTDVPATDNGDGTWSGVIPGQAVDTVVAWYISAATADGASSVTPAGAPLFSRTFTVQTAPEPGQGAVHLLLTEVCVQPNEAEFFEVHNPFEFEVALENYAVSDAIFRGDNQNYWRIVQPNPNSGTAGGGTFNDFHGRFPDGTVLGPGQTITVAIGGADAFFSVYGEEPDYELYDVGELSAEVPNLAEVFSGSITGDLPDRPPGLSNAAETLILYYWDGTTDLVTDVDVYIWGDDDRFRFSKTGVVIDGPDDGTEGSAYLPETGVFDQTPFLEAHANGNSYQRTEADEGSEIQQDSNGTSGHDEVSEDWEQTWRVDLPTPGSPSFVASGEGKVSLTLPPRTFLPRLGERFPIGFSTQKDHETRLRIFDLEGRVVLQLYDSRYDGFASTDPANPTVKLWDGRDSQYELVKAGTYVVHLSAVNAQSGQEEVVTAPVVVATRLSK